MSIDDDELEPDLQDDDGYEPYCVDCGADEPEACDCYLNEEAEDSEYCDLCGVYLDGDFHIRDANFPHLCDECGEDVELPSTRR